MRRGSETLSFRGCPRPPRAERRRRCVVQASRMARVNRYRRTRNPQTDSGFGLRPLRNDQHAASTRSAEKKARPEGRAFHFQLVGCAYWAPIFTNVTSKTSVSFGGNPFLGSEPYARSDGITRSEERRVGKECSE